MQGYLIQWLISSKIQVLFIFIFGQKIATDLGTEVFTPGEKRYTEWGRQKRTL